MNVLKKCRKRKTEVIDLSNLENSSVVNLSDDSEEVVHIPDTTPISNHQPSSLATDHVRVVTPNVGSIIDASPMSPLSSLTLDVSPPSNQTESHVRLSGNFGSLVIVKQLPVDIKEDDIRSELEQISPSVMPVLIRVRSCAACLVFSSTDLASKFRVICREKCGNKLLSNIPNIVAEEDNFSFKSVNVILNLSEGEVDKAPPSQPSLGKPSLACSTTQDFTQSPPSQPRVQPCLDESSGHRKQSACLSSPLSGNGTLAFCFNIIQYRKFLK